MTDIHDRLIRCFTTVFPAVSPEAAPEATQESVAGWDSAAAITLTSVIEEEFQISVDFELVPELSTFARIEHYLNSCG